jgi:hypothetical protein
MTECQAAITPNLATVHTHIKQASCTAAACSLNPH